MHVKISDFGVSHFSLPLFRRGRGLALEYHEDEEAALDSHSCRSSRRQPHASQETETDAELEARDQAELARTTGSPAFFAPELCLSGERPLSTAQCLVLGNPPPPGQPAPPAPLTRGGRVINQAIDIWALGVTLYCLLFGSLPFNSPTEFALFSVIPWYDYALPRTMGADQVRIGPRKLRWDASRLQATVHDHEMTSSVSRFFQQTDGTSSMILPSASSALTFEADLQQPDALLEELSLDACFLRDLLGGILEKDPDTRFPLDAVKASPWITKGLPNPQAWLDATDPELGPYVPVYFTDVPDAATVSKTTKPRSAAGLMALSFSRHHSSHHSSGSRTPGDGSHRPSGPGRRKSEPQFGSNFGQRMRSQVNRVRSRMQRRDSSSTPNTPGETAASPDLMTQNHGFPGHESGATGPLTSQTIGPSGGPSRPNLMGRGEHRFASLPLSRPTSDRPELKDGRSALTHLFPSTERPASALSAPLSLPPPSDMQWHASEPVASHSATRPDAHRTDSPSRPASLAPRPLSALDGVPYRSMLDSSSPANASSSTKPRRATAQPEFPSLNTPSTLPVAGLMPSRTPSLSLKEPSSISSTIGDTASMGTTVQTTPSSSAFNGATGGATGGPNKQQRHSPFLLYGRIKLRRQKSTNSLRSSNPPKTSSTDLPYQAPPSSYAASTTSSSDAPPPFLRSSRRSVTTSHASHPSAGSLGSSSNGIPSIRDMPRFPRERDSVDETGMLDLGARNTVQSPAPSLAAAGQVMSRSFTPTLSRTASGTPQNDDADQADRPSSPTSSLRARLQRFNLHRRQRSRTNTNTSASEYAPPSRPTSGMSPSPASPQPGREYVSSLDMARSPGSNHTVVTKSSHSTRMVPTSSGLSNAEMHVSSSMSPPGSSLLSSRGDGVEATAAPTEEEVDDLSDDELDADLHAAAQAGFWHNDGSGWKFVSPEGSDPNGSAPPPLAAQNADPLAHLECAGPQDIPDLIPGVDGTTWAPEDLPSPQRSSVEGGYNLYKHVDWNQVRAHDPPQAAATLAKALTGEQVDTQELREPMFPPQSYVSPHRSRPESQQTAHQSDALRGIDMDTDSTGAPAPLALSQDEDASFDTFSTERPSYDDGRFSDAEEEGGGHNWSMEGAPQPPNLIDRTPLHPLMSTPVSQTDPTEMSHSSTPSNPPAQSEEAVVSPPLPAYSQANREAYHPVQMPSIPRPEPTPASSDSVVNLSSIGVDSVMARVLRNPEMISADSSASLALPPNSLSLPYSEPAEDILPHESTPQGY